MSPNSELGRREFIAIVAAAVLIQMFIGAVATVRGDMVAWGSLLHRPLLLIALCFVALTTKRGGHLLLVSWFSFLAVMYAYGGFAASYPVLRNMRWIAAAFFAWSTVRLMTSEYIRASSMNLHAVPHPYPPYARKVARNSAALWILLRLVSLFATGATSPSVLIGVAVVVITATLVWLDGQRFREHLFHANLGTSPVWAIGISLMVAGVLEILAQILLRALA